MFLTIDLLDQNIYKLIKNQNHEIFKGNSTGA